MTSTFIKTCGSARVAEWEQAGLEWLARAEAHGGARTARVLERDGARLTLERIDEAPATPHAAEAFGAALAHTHDLGQRAGAGGDAGEHAEPRWSFGMGPQLADGTLWSGHGYQGPAGQHLTLELAAPGQYEAWGAMYADLRIEPLLREASEEFSERDRQTFSRLCERLRTGDFDDDDPPARIHGDLWAGNLLFAEPGAVLIDPAAYAGHREDDLAALALFGAPHLRDIVAGYQDVHPLASGWRDRVELHQLHLVLLHVALFGGSYGQQALAIARRYA